jgi:hypothetical protein
VQAIVQSFLGFGLQSLKPRLGGWEWAELQDINAGIHWQVLGCVDTGSTTGDAKGSAASSGSRVVLTLHLVYICL